MESMNMVRWVIGARLGLVGASIGLIACGATVDIERAAEAGATQGDASHDPGPDDVTRAVSTDSEAARTAADRLRTRGRAGLQDLVAAHPETLASLQAGERTPAGERLRRAIDRVSGQRDGHASGLYWHTDLDEARAEAERSGRPILSLRLLGRLDEEMSCANSRYFRVVLYSHPELAAAALEGRVDPLDNPLVRLSLGLAPAAG